MDSVPMDEVRFSDEGYVSVVSQDIDTGQVLLIGSMTRETLAETMRIGKMVYWSRSRNERWLKGETSGDVQLVREVYVNCEENTLLFKVEQQGKGACHTGNFTCYFRTLDPG
jgi:phosphoribosyl-AMP cyclohydrolase